MALVETLVSMSILLIGMTLVFAASRTYIEFQTNQEHVTAAMALAQGQLENLLLRYPDDPDLTTGAHGPVFFDALGIPGDTDSEYEVRWQVSQHAILDGLREVSVTVGWEERVAGQRYLSLASVRSGE